MKVPVKGLCVAIFVLASTIAYTSLARAQQDVPRDMVVMVNAEDPNGRKFFGAGVIVGYSDEGHAIIATARHVVYQPFLGPLKVSVIHRSTPEKPVSAEIVKSDFNKDLDLAVLSANFFNVEPSKNLQIGVLRDVPEVGDHVMHIGQTEGKLWAESPLTEKVGMKVPGRIVVQSNFGGPGLSGGAVFDESGRIIGIALTDDRSLINILPLSVIAEELRDYKIPFFIEEGKRRLARLDTETALSILNAAKDARDGANLGQVGAVALLIEEGYDFAGFDLSGVYLGGAEMAGANFKGARFWFSNLENAILESANLSETGMRFAQVGNADFGRSTIRSAYAPFLSGADVNFADADLSGGMFLASDLTGAIFKDADLSGAVFAFADLKGADFSGADLTNAHFVAADLSGTKFAEAKFGNTNMLAARLNPFDLEPAQRAGTCQAGVGRRVAQFKLVERWESTKRRSGFEYRDLNYDNDFLVPGMDMSFLPPCIDFPNKIDGFYPTGPGEFSIALDRGLISVANRRQVVLEQLDDLFRRYEGYADQPIIYGPVEP